MSELCCKFQIPALNIVGGVNNTRVWYGQNVYVIQGGIILQ